MSVCEQLGIVNFYFSQARFDICILDWMFVKVSYKKHKNWVRANDFDFYLMQALLSNDGFYWYNSSLKGSSTVTRIQKGLCFFSSFVELILELNGIVSKEEDLVEAPNISNEFGVSMMKYYKDSDGVYDIQVYDDRIVKSMKDTLIRLMNIVLGCYLLM